MVGEEEGNRRVVEEICLIFDQIVYFLVHVADIGRDVRTLQEDDSFLVLVDLPEPGDEFEEDLLGVLFLGPGMIRALHQVDPKSKIHQIVHRSLVLNANEVELLEEVLHLPNWSIDDFVEEDLVENDPFHFGHDLAPFVIVQHSKRDVFVLEICLQFPEHFAIVL